jgi:hypothetical protein
MPVDLDMRTGAAFGKRGELIERRFGVLIDLDAGVGKAHLIQQQSHGGAGLSAVVYLVASLPRTGNLNRPRLQECTASVNESDRSIDLGVARLLKCFETLCLHACNGGIDFRVAGTMKSNKSD